jgi:hypothetical protein
MRYTGLTACQTMVFMLILFCLAFCSIQTISSQISATVRVMPSQVSTLLGESFTVTISLSDVQNLYGLEVILNWNPAVLRATTVDIRLGVESFSDGVLHESSYSPPIFIAESNLTQTKGEYRLVATSMSPAPSFNGSGNIVRIAFDPINIGNSELDLESQLFDYPPIDRDPRISLSIDHATLDSFVTVKKSTATPTPTSTLTPTPTSTITPTGSPSATPEPSTLNLRIEHVLAISAIIIIIIVLILLALRRRKQLMRPNSQQTI